MDGNPPLKSGPKDGFYRFAEGVVYYNRIEFTDIRFHVFCLKTALYALIRQSQTDKLIQQGDHFGVDHPVEIEFDRAKPMFCFQNDIFIFLQSILKI